MEVLKYIVDNSTSLISLCGALAGLLAGIVATHKHFTDNGKLEVTARLVDIYNHSLGSQLSKCLQVIIVNTGKRPITLMKWYWQFNSKFEDGVNKVAIFKPEDIKGHLPVTLKESDVHNIFWNYSENDNLSNVIMEFDNIYVVDSSEKKWHLSDKNKQELLKQIEELLIQEEKVNV